MFSPTPTQWVKADEHLPLAGTCLRFLPLKGTFSLTTLPTGSSGPLSRDPQLISVWCRSRCSASALLIQSVVLTCPVCPFVPDTTALSWLDSLGRGADFVFHCISSSRFSSSFHQLAVKRNNKSSWKFAPPDGMKIHFIMSVLIQLPAFISLARLGDYSVLNVEDRGKTTHKHHCN